MFIESSEFPFLARLQSDWRVILDELVAINKSYFINWPEKGIYNGEWKVFGLYKFGTKIHELCKMCPRTTELIEEIPGLVTAGFSSLAANTHITPHIGYTTQVLRCHLGLITPEYCAIRVANETRSWLPGSCFVFDDTYEHEAWNKSDSTRVVLLLDFKRKSNMQIVYPKEVLDYEPLRKIK
jgi:ornithine lipid ester-linked acyl 2-hydroxylase